MTVQVGVDGAGSAYVGALATYLANKSGFQVEVVVPEGANSESHVVVTCQRDFSDADRISRIAESTAVVVVGASDNEAMLAALEAGASGYLEEGTAFEEAAMTLSSVASGKVTIPPTMLGRLLRHVIDQRRAEQDERRRLRELTRREREVFGLVALGYGNEAVADRLYISPATVRTHVQRVFRKLDVHSRAEAVALAARCGLSIDSGAEP